MSSSKEEIFLDKERFHVNPFLGKESSMDPFEKGPYSFQEGLRLATVSLMERLTEAVVRDVGEEEDLSVYTGVAGILLTYQVISSGRTELMVHSSMKERLKQFPQKVLQSQGLKGRRFTFLCGDSGPLVTAFMMTNDAKDRAKLLNRLLELQDVVCAKVSKDGSPIPNELLYGRAGYLYALLFLNQKFPQDPPLIPRSVVAKLVSSIIEDGINKKSRNSESPPLHYEWHDKVYIGGAHGYAGILYILLKAQAYMTEEQIVKVKETLDWMLKKNIFPSGNFRSSVGSNHDKLVHWCHGAPGAIFMCLEAAKVFPTDEKRYLKAALASGDVIWNRGILKRSYSLCHGVSGNAYSLLAIYKFTNDPVWLQRACFFAQWCFCWGKLSTRQPDRPNSLFEGLAGIVYMMHDLYDFLSKSGSGSIPKFPAFELD